MPVSQRDRQRHLRQFVRLLFFEVEPVARGGPVQREMPRWPAKSMPVVRPLRRHLPDASHMMIHKNSRPRNCQTTDTAYAADLSRRQLRGGILHHQASSWLILRDLLGNFAPRYQTYALARCERPPHYPG